MAGVEQQAFIQSSERGIDEKAAKKVQINFILFALCFSLSLGTVTASIPLATSQFGDSLGSYSLGTLYSLYTVAAMFLSVPLLSALGTKTALVLGQALYAVYVGSYLLGREIHHSQTRWIIVLFGAAIGGVAAGLVWPAQQGYFTKCAATHAEALTPAGSTREEIQIMKKKSTAKFSSVFATVYLGIEVLMKMLSSFIQLWACTNKWHGDFLTGRCGVKGEPDPSEKDKGQIIVFVLYLSLSITACLLMLIVPMPVSEHDKEEEKKKEEEGTKPNWIEKSKDAVALMGRNPKILLMSGVNMAFGGTAAYLNSYVTGTVIKQGLGDDKVGYFVSIIPLLATLESIPFGKLMECIGTKVPLIIFGMMCFGGFAFAFAVVSDPVEDLGKWAVLPALFCVFGTGRAVWEGPNKAVTADFFPGKDAQPAGANIVFQNGLTSAVAFYVYPSLSSRVKSIVCVGFAVWGIVGYLIAHFLFQAQHKRENEEHEARRIEEAS
eukprot:Hpha_TRINITY_DN15803_c3_g1::TRINITY_DN15803_c3_g1_i1::g.189844::m.189844